MFLCILPLSFIFTFQVDADHMDYFRKGDDVLLFRNGYVVASGTVQKILPSERCGREILGEGYLGILVESVTDAGYSLECSSTLFLTIGEAVDSVIMWPKIDVKFLNNLGGDSQLNVPPQSPDIDMSPHELEGEGRDHLAVTSVFPGPHNSCPRIDSVLHRTSSASSNVDLVETISTSSLPSTQLCEGDLVWLLQDGMSVADAKVLSVDPKASCHNRLIGDRNISVSVLKCYPGSENVLLPTNHNQGANTLSESVGSFAVWPLENVLDKRYPLEGSQRS